MDIEEDKMKEALAEILNVDLDIISSLNIEPQMEYGKDDIFYGYYVNYPQRDTVNEQIKDYDETQLSKIPWGETIYYTEAQFGDTKDDPFNWQSDWKEEFYMLSTMPPKEDVVNELKHIKDLIGKQQENLIIKSLLASAFSITEGYICSIVKESILENIEGSTDKSLKYIKGITDKLEKQKDRIQLYKKYTGKALKYIPCYREVRIYLAHNIFSAEILDGDIVINNRDGKISKYKIVKIINDLLAYVENPIE